MFTVYAALVTVQILFGIWPIAGALALNEVSPPALIGFRTLVGGPLLFLLLSSSRRWPSRQDLLALAALSTLGIVGNQLLYAEGLKRAGPINAVVMIVIVP
ncbi:MAG: EamA family transporter, partial [Myxococcota bacterium]